MTNLVLNLLDIDKTVSATANVTLTVDQDLNFVAGGVIPANSVQQYAVGSSASLPASDDATMLRTESLGYTVTVKATWTVNEHGNRVPHSFCRTIQIVGADGATVDLSAKGSVVPIPPAGIVVSATDINNAATNAKTALANSSAAQISAAAAAYQAQSAATNAATVTGSQAAVNQLAAYRTQGTAALTVAVAGDTTWTRAWATSYGASMPAALSRTYKAWSGSAYTTTNDSAGSGTPGTPGTGGTFVSDGFGRSGEIVGSTPDGSGPVWGGKTGCWAGNGTAAVATAVGAIQQQAPTGDVTLTATLPLVTSATAAAQILRFFVQSPSLTATTVNGVWASLTVAASGAVTASLVKTISGTTTTIAACNTTGIVAAQAAAQVVTVTLAMSGLNATLTVQKTGSTLNTATGAITSADQATLGTYVGVLAATAGASGMPLDAITAATPSTPGTPGSPASGITWAVHPGLTTTDIGAAYPAGQVDVLLVGADQASAAPFVTAFKTAHPETAVAVVSGADVPALTSPRTTTDNAAAIIALQAGGTKVGIKGSPLTQLRTLKGFGTGLCRIGIISDSTAADPTSWPRTWDLAWGALLPSNVNRTYQVWNDTSGVFGTAIVDNAGTAPSTGVILTDTFTRTGEIVGSTPDTGPAWGGQSGYWTANGSQAVNTTGFASISVNLASGDQVAIAHLTLNTTAPAAAQSFRLYLGAAGSGTGVYCILNLSTAGALTIQLYKNLNGGSGNASLTSAIPIPGVSAGQTGVALTLNFSSSVQNMTLTVTAAGQTTTLTGQIAENEVFQRGYNAFVSGGAAGSYFAAIEDITLETTAATNPPPTPTLTIWNGSVPGAGITFWSATKRAQVFGGKTLDVILIALGYNQQSQAASDFVTAIAAMVAAIGTEHPEASIVFCSQAPEFAPAAAIANHAARQAALRIWAQTNGYDYIGAYEAFAAQSDGGKSLVGPDGVHPTLPPAGTTTGAYGAVLWANTVTTAIGS